MVTGQHLRLQSDKPVEYRAGMGPNRQIPRQVLQRCHRLLDNVALRDWLGFAEDREQIAAEEGSSRLFEDEDRVPGVRHMRRDEKTQLLLPEVQHLVVAQAAYRPVEEVPDAEHYADLAMHRLGFGRDTKKLVQRPALIRLEVRPADVRQRGRVDYLLHRFQRLREKPLRSGMEQQRLLSFDQELAELYRRVIPIEA